VLLILMMLVIHHLVRVHQERLLEVIVHGLRVNELLLRLLLLRHSVVSKRS
jgi:hypothetical protein